MPQKANREKQFFISIAAAGYPQSVHVVYRQYIIMRITMKTRIVHQEL